MVVVVVVLLPKAEGGFRTIGLIPNAPKIWMKVRQIDAKAWEISCVRNFLYAGAGRGRRLRPGSKLPEPKRQRREASSTGRPYST